MGTGVACAEYEYRICPIHGWELVFSAEMSKAMSEHTIVYTVESTSTRAEAKKKIS